MFRADSKSDDLSVHLIRAAILKRPQPRLPANDANYYANNYANYVVCKNLSSL